MKVWDKNNDLFVVLFVSYGFQALGLETVIINIISSLLATTDHNNELVGATYTTEPKEVYELSLDLFVCWFGHLQSKMSECP